MAVKPRFITSLGYGNGTYVGSFPQIIMLGYFFQHSQSALGREDEMLYGSIRQTSLSLSGDTPPTEVNLQSRMDPTPTLRPSNRTEEEEHIQSQIHPTPVLRGDK